MTAVLTAVFATQSYLFLVSCTVLASFIQYVPSILAVIKFKHSNEFPNHGFSLPGKYTIPILALTVSCYMVTNFKPLSLFKILDTLAGETPATLATSLILAIVYTLLFCLFIKIFVYIFTIQKRQLILNQLTLS